MLSSHECLCNYEACKLLNLPLFLLIVHATNVNDTITSNSYGDCSDSKGREGRGEGQNKENVKYF